MEQGPGSEYVQINAAALQDVAQRLEAHAKAVVWDEEAWHYQPPAAWRSVVRNERLALYILALDAVNFCFWPTDKFEYADLASSMARMAEQDHDQQQQQQDVGDQVSPTYVFSPKNLANVTVPKMAALFQKHHPNGTVPNDLEQRCRLWNELGTALLQHFDGSAMQLIQRADGSVLHLPLRM